MPNISSNVSFVNVRTADTVSTNSDCSYVTYITDPRPVISASTFTTKTTYAPEIWESPDNPYFDYVTELKNLTKNVKVKDNQVFIDGDFASYRKLAQLVQGYVNIYNRYKNLKSYEEPNMKGDEFNE